MNIFLTGKVKTGKSALIRNALYGKKLTLGGFKTISMPADIPDAEYKVYIVPAGGEPEYGENNLVGIRWGGGSFTAYPEVFDTVGLSILENAEKSDLIIMDELGFMENEAAAFVSRVRELLECAVPVLGVVKEKNGVLSDYVRSAPDTKIVEVTEENRGELTQGIHKLFGELNVSYTPVKADFTYDYYKVSADYIKRTVNFEPEIAIVLGTGLGPFASTIENPVEMEYRQIPNFLVSTVDGHAGKLIFGTVAGRKVVCMAGRFHYYEGYDYEQLSIPVRVLKLLGVQKLILTNAAGAVNPDYAPGDVVVIKDHIKFFDSSPMRGRNISEFGPRFFDTTNLYKREFRELALKAGEKSPLNVHEGVYFYFSGPQFETPAEVRAARILGGDLVGMSTVTEALTAAHCGMPVLAMSVVTNMAAGVVESAIAGEKVEETGRRIAADFSAYVTEIVRNI